MENKKNQHDNGDLSNQKIMLIGGAGFIGHHLALELRKKKATVTVLDNLQVNNIVQMLSDTKISERKRNLYIHFILERFQLMRDLGISFPNIDARNLNLL